MKGIELSIDTTYRCPFNCCFCSTGDLAALYDMGIETAEKCRLLLEKISYEYDLPCDVVIVGGEPIAASNLDSIINVFSINRNWNITVCTTGAIKKPGQYWKQLYESGLKKVRLSLHSVDEAQCKEIYGKNYRLSVVKNTISNILSTGIDIEINYLITALNRDSLYNVCNFIHQYDIVCIRILGLSMQGKAVDNWNLLKIKENAIGLKEIKEMCSRFNIEPEFSGFGGAINCTHSDQGRCMGGITFFHINTNGDVYKCPASKSNPLKKIGNVFSSINLTDNNSIEPCCIKY